RIAEGHGAGRARIAAVTDRLVRAGDDEGGPHPGAAVTVVVAIDLDGAVAALPAAVAVPGLGPALHHDGTAIAGGGVKAGAGLMGLGRAGDQNRRAGGGVE